MSSDKSTINRKVLAQHGIILSEVVISPRNSDIRIPEYVRFIIEALLEHDIQIPDHLRSLFEKEQQQQSPEITDAKEYTVSPPTTAFYSLPHDLKKPLSREIKAIEDKFENIAQLARIAREYDVAKVSQETWEHFLGSYIFRSFEDSGMQTSRHSKIFDAWSLEKNVSWKAVSKLNQVSEDPPQPSFTYGFPVHIPDDTDKSPTGFNRNENVTNFSLNILADLGPIVTCLTIHPSALKARMTEGQKPDRGDLICVPWALVEVQSATEPVEACYCRAANGANAALDMQRQLQPVWAVEKDIPPVIFFTCSGPEIRVWLSFLGPKISKPFTRCICIWAGTLTATWCILTLREIIQNMTFWASRVLKPRVSARISQIQPIVSVSPAYPHGTIPFRNTALHKPQALKDINESKSEGPNSSTKGDSSSQQKMFGFGWSSNVPVKTEKSHTEDNDTSKTNKPTSSVQSDLLFSEQNFKSFDAAIKTEKPHTEDTNTSKIEKPMSSLQSGLLSAEQKPSIINSFDAMVKIRRAKYVSYRGKKIPIRLPSNDERKPRRVTEADWKAKSYSWLRARQAIILGQTGLGDEQNTSEGGAAVAEISGDLQSLQIAKSDENEANKEVAGKLGLEKSTPDSGEGELETKKSSMLDTKTQSTHPDWSQRRKDQPFESANTGVDGSDEVDDDAVGKYFVYRTYESFHARSYNAAIWDSDGENDQSYVASVSASEADSEVSDVDIEEDDADDEESESASSHNYDDASIEELLSELKTENERVENSSPSSRGPPGQVSNLTLDDLDDLLYNAASVISGEDFIQLKPIQTLLENLNGVDLLDATWRALENWEGQSPNLYSDQMRRLLATVENLNNFVASQDENLINLFAHHHLTMALRKHDLDQTLQSMQKKGDWRLRDLLESLLRSWDGEKCMELLSNELLEMGPEQFDNMLQEAFDIVYSDSNLLDTVR